MSLVAEAFVSQIAAAEPWPENATLYQQLKGEQILLSDNAASLAVQCIYSFNILQQELHYTIIPQYFCSVK
uniref:Metaxin 2 n=1 Tax=Lynx canadensis TaxID=61383 RepID=A0A667GTY7_LYNCA